MNHLDQRPATSRAHDDEIAKLPCAIITYDELRSVGDCSYVRIDPFKNRIRCPACRQSAVLSAFLAGPCSKRRLVKEYVAQTYCCEIKSRTQGEARIIEVGVSINRVRRFCDYRERLASVKNVQDTAAASCIGASVELSQSGRFELVSST